MNKYCGDCKNLGRKESETYKNWYTGKTTYKCLKNGEYKKIDDKACSSLVEFKDTGSYTPSGCYITTIVCNILGYEDDCDLLKVFRSFRDNVLKNDERYITLLQEYDQIGPEISKRIIASEYSSQIAIDMYSTFLRPCLRYINKGDVDNAVKIYKFMVVYLKSRLGLNDYVVNYSEEYNIETLGKGRIKKIETSE